MLVRDDFTDTIAVESWTIVAELGRVLVAAYVLAQLLARLKIAEPLIAMRLGLVVWVGFQAVLLLGVLQGGFAWPLYAIHGGDALVKTLVTCAIVGVFHLRAATSLNRRRRPLASGVGPRVES